MMNDYAQKRYAALKEELALFSEMGILPVKRLTGSLSCIRQALHELETYLTDHAFPDQQSEIHFFKYEKPRFMALHQYAIEYYAIESRKPLEDDLILKNYYQLELQFIRRFFIQYCFLYQYYRQDAIELDYLYFIRGARIPSALVPYELDTQSKFSNNYSCLFASFIAYERLQEYLRQKLKSEYNFS